MFRVPLSCSLFCEFSLFDLIKFSVLTAQCRLYLPSPPCGMACVLFQTINWGLIGLTSLVSHPWGIIIFCCLVSSVIKKHCFIYFVCPLCLSYLRERGILGPCCFTFIQSKVPPGDHLKISKPRPHPQNK